MSACLLATGRLPNGRPPTAWDDALGAIIHYDFKPPNNPDKTMWPNIAQAKLTDFGLALHANTPGYPNGIKDNGTASWLAPEQHRYEDPNLDSVPITSAANVYSVGKTMVSILCLMQREQEQAARYDRNDGAISLPTWLWDNYPKDMLSLIKRCVKPYPNQRIMESELLEDIVRAVQAFPEAQDSLPVKMKGLEYSSMLRTKPDVYAMFAR